MLEKRKAVRYPLSQHLSYRILDARSHYRPGTGVTVDMSSSGVLFAAEQPLPSGKRVELSIHWAAQRDGGWWLKLVVTGRIVRVQDGREQLEFGSELLLPLVSKGGRDDDKNAPPALRPFLSDDASGLDRREVVPLMYGKSLELLTVFPVAPE